MCTHSRCHVHEGARRDGLGEDLLKHSGQIGWGGRFFHRDGDRYVVEDILGGGWEGGEVGSGL